MSSENHDRFVGADNRDQTKIVAGIQLMEIIYMTALSTAYHVVLDELPNIVWSLNIPSATHVARRSMQSPL